jgi:hypothetical protein
MPGLRCHFLLGVAGAALPIMLQAACETPVLRSPAEKSITDKQARLTWTSVSGATGYRVRLLSRVPNGKIVASHDTVVSEAQFMPPQPLAEQQAKVVVRLNAICGSETSAESVSSFIIDTSPACVMGELAAAASAGKASLQWPAVAGATRYEVRAYAVLDGQLVASKETRTPGAQVDLKGQSAVVSVQPACASGMGEAVYRVMVAR